MGTSNHLDDGEWRNGIRPGRACYWFERPQRPSGSDAREHPSVRRLFCPGNGTRPLVAHLRDLSHESKEPCRFDCHVDSLVGNTAGDVHFSDAREQAAALGNVRDLWSALAHLLPIRSEEHTSELQSRFDLVCRLLLEKKK